MKIKELLNRKIDSKTLFELFKLFLGGPIKAVYDMFNHKTINNRTFTNFVYDLRTSQPVIIRSEKIMSQYEQVYSAGEAMRPGFAIDSVKYGIKKEICDQIMRSDLFEWIVEDTPMGTKISGKIIVNKFQK